MFIFHVRTIVGAAISAYILSLNLLSKGICLSTWKEGSHGFLGVCAEQPLLASGSKATALTFSHQMQLANGKRMGLARMCPTMGGLSLFPTTKFGGIHEKSEELNKHFPESDGIHD